MVKVRPEKTFLKRKMMWINSKTVPYDANGTG